ncbi:MAG: hypothetical protein Q8922_06915 [Bacteroidota bacterium]|nr:hypothetical protein [Bacteroidota bacterium]MDP4234045.1 hypothetical protein [Bacteroidota bacterium]MDP4242911.1 hypothetical protein [Bacteroidota bacterium]MDP4287650.1 hypothetical protein [Bacteroidota bacterium]
MESSLNGQYREMNAESDESLDMTHSGEVSAEDASPSFYHNAIQVGRNLLQREMGFGGYLILAVVLMVILVVYGYFFGNPLHGAAGPD